MIFIDMKKQLNEVQKLQKVAGLLKEGKEVNNSKKEYQFKVAKDILEVGTGYETKVARYKVGTVLTLSEKEYNTLASGQEVERLTREGMVEFDKSYLDPKGELIETIIQRTEVNL